MLILVIVATSALIILPGSSAASANKAPSASAPFPSGSVAQQDAARQAATAATDPLGLARVQNTRFATLPLTPWTPEALFFPQAQPPLATYASDCMTAQTSFGLGDTICVKVSGAPTGVTPLQRIVLGNTANFTVDSVDVTTSSQTATFTLPSTTTTGGVDNRGPWIVGLVDTADATLSRAVLINVSDAAHPAADLTISKIQLNEGTLIANTNISYQIYVWNRGPDSATNARFSDNTLPNTTFVSLTQTSGPTFNCTTPTAGIAGTSNCTAATFARGDAASFTVIYHVNASVGNGAELTDTATVTSDTEDQANTSNSSDVSSSASNPTPPACSLTCPTNISVPAASGQDGAVVTFSAPTTSGTCGTVTSVPASGSFFHIGSSVVTSTTTGGESCSFIVTVTDAEAPSISCPGDITIAEPSAGAGATVNYTGLSASDNSGTVAITCKEGATDKPSGSNFDVGMHSVTCTATDPSNNSNDCTFVVTVTAPACTLTPHADVSADAPSGSCATTVTYTDPTTMGEGDACDGVTITCNHPSGSSFPVGDTTVTCSASRNGTPTGATTSFTVTVHDVTAPVPDLSSLPTASGECSATAGIPTTVIIRDQLGNPIGTKVVFEPPTATDSCGGKIAGSTNDPRTYDEPGNYTVHWTYTDASGNSSTQNQTVSVTGPNGGLDISGAPVVSIHNPVGSTACSIEIDDIGALLNTSVTGTCGDYTIARAVSPTPVDNVYLVGTTYTVVSTVTEGNSTDSVTQTFKIIDDTPPVVVSVPANASYQCPSEVPAASPSQATATDNCVAPIVTVSDTNNGGAGSAASPLIITRTYTATDATNPALTASKSQTITVIDNTAPTISCPANITVYLPLNTSDTSMVVNYQTPVGSDNCGGAITTQTTGLPTGSAFPVGTTTNTFRVTDSVGQFTECSFTVTVLYDFSGFFSPVANLPTYNQVNAGRAIPVKFSLSGNKGLSIFATGYPVSQQIACDTGAPVADVVETLTAGSSSLSYSSSSDQYNYVWATSSSWAGTCRQLTVKLNDGTEHKANFKFR